MELENGLLDMTTRFGYLGAALAVAGLCLGIVGLAVDGSALSLLAGVLALGAGLACVVLDRQSASARWAQGLLADELTAAKARAEGDTTAEQREPEEPVLVDEPRLEPRPLPPPRVSGPATADSPSFIEDDPDPSATDSLIDPVTGLFSEGFYRVALDGRIAAARRHLRPVAMVLIEVVQGLPGEPDPVEATLVGEVIKTTLREADTACRLNNGHFALLLEDTPENGAIWTVERIRRKLLTDHDGLTVWAGVACYPAHAFGTSELIDAAAKALVSAREWRQDRIEVATAAD